MEVFKEAPVVEVATKETPESDANLNNSEVKELEKESVEDKQASARWFTSLISSLSFDLDHHQDTTDDVKIIWAATWQNQQNECVPSKDSDHPGHPPILIRVFAMHSMGS